MLGKPAKPLSTLIEGKVDPSASMNIAPDLLAEQNRLFEEKLWLGRLDSNQGWRYQKPLPYRLATPQHDHAEPVIQPIGLAGH